MRRRAWGRLPAALGSVACMLVTLTACSPLDMLAFLGGCKNTGGSSTVQASQASGEWTGLVGRHQDQIKQMWPGQVSFCAPYDYGFQCTWWACMRQKSSGHDIGQYWGNGGEWDTSARNAGWEQGAQAGGIIVFKSGRRRFQQRVRSCGRRGTGERGHGPHERRRDRVGQGRHALVQRVPSSCRHFLLASQRRRRHRRGIGRAGGFPIPLRSGFWIGYNVLDSPMRDD